MSNNNQNNSGATPNPAPAQPTSVKFPNNVIVPQNYGMSFGSANQTIINSSVPQAPKLVSVIVQSQKSFVTQNERSLDGNVNSTNNDNNS